MLKWRNKEPLWQLATRVLSTPTAPHYHTLRYHLGWILSDISQSRCLCWGSLSGWTVGALIWSSDLHRSHSEHTVLPGCYTRERRVTSSTWLATLKYEYLLDVKTQPTSFKIQNRIVVFHASYEIVGRSEHSFPLKTVICRAMHNLAQVINNYL
jgi:hypothetical protein